MKTAALTKSEILAALASLDFAEECHESVFGPFPAHRRAARRARARLELALDPRDAERRRV